MIPKMEKYAEFEEDEEDLEDFREEQEPSYTYKMKIPTEEQEMQKCKFVGKTDDIEALKQAILKIVHTERYEHEIYSWDYGIETKDLYGMPISYVMSEIKAQLTDAILADDRFENVEDFQVEQIDRHTIHCYFTVITVDEEEIESDYDFDMTGGDE